MRVKIVSRPPQYDAIQYTGNNEGDVAAFVGFLFRPGTASQPPAIYDPISLYFRNVNVGSWVTLVGATMTVFSDEEFRAAYAVVN